MKLQLIAVLFKIAPPFFVALLLVKLQLIAVPLQIAPPFFAELSLNVQFTISSPRYMAPPFSIARLPCRYLLRTGFFPSGTYPLLIFKRKEYKP